MTLVSRRDALKISAGCAAMIGVGGSATAISATPKVALKKIGPEAFGFHVNRYLWNKPNSTPEHNVGFHCVRMWDIFSNWRQTERVKGVFTWDRIDTVVAGHRKAGRSLIYTVAETPEWAAGLPHNRDFYAHGPTPPVKPQDYANFARTIAERNRSVYGGAIEAIELGNEPDFHAFWSGTVQEHVEMTALAIAEIRKVDKNILILTPGISAGGWSWFDEYVRLSEGLKGFDVVSYHAYASPDQPERSALYTSRVRAIMEKHSVDKPIWCTELGFLAYRDGNREMHDNLVHLRAKDPMEYMNLDFACAYLVRNMLVELSQPRVERVQWYAMDAPAMILPIANPADYNEMLSPGLAFKRLSMLLAGGRLGALTQEGDVWEVDFQTNDGRDGKAMWMSDFQVAEVDLSKYRAAEDVLGISQAIDSQFKLNHSPIYVFY